MNIEELKKQLPTKRRDISDLARFISTRTDQNPNYTLLLGAGCSVTSGIRSADALVKEWRSEFCPHLSSIEEQRTFLKDNFSDWYDPLREYSSLFEKKFDLQRQRRMFVEKEVSGKTPSLGYAYVTALVLQNYFHTIFTTNFDDLVNEAFYLYSDQRPIVCAHDSSINSITVTSKRPKIIKLHGDYLFEDLKATSRETESLEQNMKAKFAEFAKDYGMIVVGYAACDRSVMDAISVLINRDDYFKGGIYWCVRKNGEISEELRKLLWKDKVFFVEIDGFDELFAELHSKFNSEQVLPISTMSVNRRPAEIIGRLISTQSAFPTSSPVLSKAIEQLERQTKRSTVVNMLFTPDADNLRPVTNEKLSDDELITQLEVQNQLNAGNYRSAIKQGRRALKTAGTVALKRNILQLIRNAHSYIGETFEAMAVCDELIALEPYSATHHREKASFIQDTHGKLAEIDKAIAVNPYDIGSYWRKGALLEQMASEKYGADKRPALEEAMRVIMLGISRDPSISNPCWSSKFNLIRTHELDKEARENGLREIVKVLEVMNPYSFRFLDMKRKLLTKDSSETDLNNFLLEVDDAKRHSYPSTHSDFEELSLQAIASTGTTSRIIEAIAAASKNFDIPREPDLAYRIASIQRSKLAQDDSAISLLRQALKFEFDGSLVSLLIEALTDVGAMDEADALLQKYKFRISESRRNRLLLDLMEAREDFDGAMNLVSGAKGEVAGIKKKTHQIYLLLRKRQFSDAEMQAKEQLQEINFSLDAEADIVNFELACKHTKGKVHDHRLQNLLKFTQSVQSKSAIFALLERKSDMLESLTEAIRKDKTFRFSARVWPVFEGYRNDPEFTKQVAG